MTKEIKHQLIKNNKVIFESDKKIDAIYAHQKYRRGQRVTYVAKVI